MGRRHPLSKKERRRLIELIRERYPRVPIDRDMLFEVYTDKPIGTIIFVDGIPAFIEIGDDYIPHLRFLLSKGYEWMPYAVVDMGAVKPLLRGADVMRPGIRRIKGSFSAGDPVVVVDEKYGKPFAVGIALYDVDRLESMTHGKVLRNVHRIGDKYWNIT